MNGYLDRRFMLLMFVSFVFLVCYLVVVANQTYVKASIQTANATRQAIETERQTITFQEILINNLLISLSLIVPLIGLIPFFIVWHNTAIIIGLLSKAYAVPPTIYITNLIVLAFPEILAYTIMISENVYVTALALFKSGAKYRITQHSWKSFIFYILLLFIGAVSEAHMIASAVR